MNDPAKHAFIATPKLGEGIYRYAWWNYCDVCGERVDHPNHSHEQRDSNFMNDGGPAFPTPDVIGPHGELAAGRSGMSIRDYFAASALTGYIAMFATAESKVPTEQAAKRCYEFADAIIAQRGKGE